jgi:uncharacterized protein (TIGR03663 family)
MATEPIYRPRGAALLDWRLNTAAINFELVAFVLVVVLSVIAHLWALDVKAMHHDESIHAWMSWKFFTGRGGFSCGFTPQGIEGAVARSSATYCYDPVYHGPSLYVATLLMYFLFGDGDAQARLPMAICGIGLTLSAWMLRPYFGRRGTLIAAVLLAFSPTLLYYTRFARHDGLIVLFEFWMVVGMFRYVDTGRPRWLYLVAAATALAVATHELYYILFFVFGLFLLIRLLAEIAPPRTTWLALSAGALISGAIILIKAVAGDMLGSRSLIGILRGPSLLLFTGFVLALLANRVWDREPVVWNRLRALWQQERSVLLVALAIYAAIYVVLYSTFFAYPRGILDGAYAGLYYWWFTQHEYARGDQPWYYYLMQLPIYEPLAVAVTFIAGAFLLGHGLNLAALKLPARRSAAPASAESAASAAPASDGPALAALPAEELGFREERDAVRLGELSRGLAPEATLERQATGVAEAPAPRTHPPLFALFLLFWTVLSVVAFSWAGEKMPWLLTHMALPGNLLAAWALGRMLDSVEWQALSDRRAWLVPPLLALLLVALGVALWRLGGDGSGLEGQSRLLQGILPLLFVGAAIYVLLTLGSMIGWRPVAALAGGTLAVLLGAYMVRASWLVNYEHPDVPVEPLIYVQSAPDVPRIVDEMSELSVALTRNARSAADATGGRSLPIIVDTELAWPLEWYMRDFTALQRQGSDFFQNMTNGSLSVSDGGLAPVVMVYKPNLSASSRAVLEQSYTLKYDTVLNWWFPEGDKCRPQEPGYKRFYFNSSTPRSVIEAEPPNGCGANAPSVEELSPLLAPIAWPFQRENWAQVGSYLLFRTLPDELELQGREMEVWVRRDLAGGGGGAAATPTSVYKLVAGQSLGAQGVGEGQFNEPRGLAVDSEGNLYVADTYNHRIQVFDADGNFVRAIGSFGTGEGQLYEPRGVAVDNEGNVFVADTWNARVSKFDAGGRFLAAWGEGKSDFGDGKRATQTDGSPEGNAAEPLGFFGPRGIAVDSEGNVYLADTGNKRIVVTDGDGNYKYQWGYAGAQPGAFDEPTSLGVDAAGNVYVADTWNGRVQVFAPDGAGQVSPQPSANWPVAGWQPNTYLDPMLGVSAAGDVFVSVPGDQAIAWYDASGQERLRWGGLGSDTASFNFPSGLAAGPAGEVYVADRGNHRVMRFELPR